MSRVRKKAEMTKKDGTLKNVANTRLFLHYSTVNLHSLFDTFKSIVVHNGVIESQHNPLPKSLAAP